MLGSSFKGILLTTAIVIQSATGLSSNLEEANSWFQKRQQNPQAIQKSIQLYDYAIQSDNLTQEDLIFAVAQQARLYAYLGYIVDQNNRELRVNLANQCLNKVNRIAPQVLNEKTPQYYYWRAVCMMARAAAKGVLQSLSDSREVAELIDTGITVDPTYQGGGFDRLAGILYSKLPAWNPMGPNGDLTRALRHFEASLLSDPYTGEEQADWLDLATETGEYYFETYFYYAEALVKANQRDQAKSLLTTAIERIEDNDIADGRRAETEVALIRMKNLLASLTQEYFL